MIEFDGYPYPTLVTFDGHVIETWEGRPDKDSTRWHVRFIKEISLGPPDRNGRSPMYIYMDIVRKLALATVPAEQRPAAEQLVAAVQQEIARRGHF